MQEILVVSNDSVGRSALLGVLDAAGYRTNGASTFSEAIGLLTDRSPDLVIADERLGAFNGLHVIIRARGEHPQVRAIVATPHHHHGLEVDARGLAVEYMIKPLNPVEWLAPISRVLDTNSIQEYPGSDGETIHAIG